MCKLTPKFEIIIALIFALIAVEKARPQWSDPVRISNDHLILQEAVAVGETLHVVGQGRGIYYLKSPDNGQTWSEPTIPHYNYYASAAPEIEYINSKLHVVFLGSPPNVGVYYPYHIISSDGGRTWSEPHLIDPSRAGYGPRLASISNSLYVTYWREHQRLSMATSSDEGQTWSNRAYHIEDGTLQYINLIKSQNRLHIFCEAGFSLDSVHYTEVIYRNSDDYGATWSERMYISTLDENWDSAPNAVADDNGRIVVIWRRYRNNNLNVFVRVSLNNGDTWEPPYALASGHSYHSPTCIIHNGVIYAAWLDYDPSGPYFFNLMYAESHDWGTSWTSPEIIATPAGRPRLVVTEADGRIIVHCIMRNDVPHEWDDLYYLHSLPSGTSQNESEAISPQSKIRTLQGNPK